METRIKKKLGARIVLYLMLMVVAFGMAMAWYIYKNADTRYNSELLLYKTHGNTLIRNFSDNIIFGLLSLDMEILGRETDKLFDDPTISYAVIYDEDFKIVHEKFKEGLIAENFPVSFDGETATEDGKDVIHKSIKSKDAKPFLDLKLKVQSLGRENSSMGWIRIGMSLDTLERQIKESIWQGAILVGGVLALGLALVLFILRSIMPPINRLAEGARRISRGELGLEVEVTSEDEIGLLTMTFNEMVKNITDQTRRAEAMIDNITDAIKLLTDTTSNLLTVSSQQASGATEQAATVEEVVATTEEIATTSSRIAESTESVSQTAKKTSETCHRGNEIMASSINDMDEIREQVDKVTDQIMDLAQQAQMIGGVIDIIEEISEQTNLLALNAAIEAAGAGESGKRFSVVANEVRHLATRTLESTESVRKMVDTIQKSTSNMVMLAEDEQKAVNTGAESVKRMGEYFQHILEMVETTSQASSEIGLITRQQSTASQQMVSSIQEVEEVAKETEKAAKEIDAYMAELKELAERLRTLITDKEESGSSESEETRPENFGSPD